MAFHSLFYTSGPQNKIKPQHGMFCFSDSDHLWVSLSFWLCINTHFVLIKDFSSTVMENLVSQIQSTKWRLLPQVPNPEYESPSCWKSEIFLSWERTLLGCLCDQLLPAFGNSEFGTSVSKHGAIHRGKGNISDCSLAPGEISNKMTTPATRLLGTWLQAAKRWVRNSSPVSVLQGQGVQHKPKFWYVSSVTF